MEDQAAQAAAAVAARLVSENSEAYAGEPGTTEAPPEAPQPEAETAGKRKFEGGFSDGLDGSDPTDGTRKRTGSSGAGEVGATPRMQAFQRHLSRSQRCLYTRCSARTG